MGSPQLDMDAVSPLTCSNLTSSLGGIGEIALRSSIGVSRNRCWVSSHEPASRRLSGRWVGQRLELFASSLSFRQTCRLGVLAGGHTRVYGTRDHTLWPCRRAVGLSLVLGHDGGSISWMCKCLLNAVWGREEERWNKQNSRGYPFLICLQRANDLVLHPTERFAGSQRCDEGLSRGQRRKEGLEILPALLAAASSRCLLTSAPVRLQRFPLGTTKASSV